ncbi:aminotransferase class I/II-fold pyridoxal phosphate-dependent enzyme [Pedobacter frigoris]|uniref:Pyridoxal phosphate-dependent aminotransferase family protein n=1 Tax=Pedobacter frigoris TaxID=2571272 RepID=A0A4U1CMZ6_9SPHI|nr:pyridoxal phosphate-dependent aminotransferase family protein [Pedobacter frigoris]TKC09281.1 pyridoxal phosphate-dependent aminotransferase family protein [Pedobacter frigoris]
MDKAEQFIKDRLKAKTEHGSLRKLSTKSFAVDFSSNDYLGFARSSELKSVIEDNLSQIPQYKNGSGGSRLLSGNHMFTEQTELLIAKFHSAESGLIFNSGYDANLGLLSSLAQRGDTIISDEFIHASLIDGARLTHANRYTFKHNSIIDLEAKLSLAKGNVYVVVESVYSMDGDLARLKEISDLCKKYHAALIVDEAHALGIFGDHGNGLVQHLKLENSVFARIVTFGKALGAHGAIVLGSKILREYLINYSRSFIYTTAAPLHNIAVIKSGYDMLIETDYTALIQDRIQYYTEVARASSMPISIGKSAIQTILYHNNSEAKNAAELLQSTGLDVRAILSPTVPEGRERLRICLHTFNTDKEIKTLIDTLSSIQEHG